MRDIGRLENIAWGYDPADDSVHPDDHVLTEPAAEQEQKPETWEETTRRYLMATAVNDACAPLHDRIRAQALRIAALTAHLDHALAELRRHEPSYADTLAALSSRYRGSVDR